jgi:hypothetical protein
VKIKQFSVFDVRQQKKKKYQKSFLLRYQKENCSSSRNKARQVSRAVESLLTLWCTKTETTSSDKEENGKEKSIKVAINFRRLTVEEFLVIKKGRERKVRAS